jgi:hypothetical protein
VLNKEDRAAESDEVNEESPITVSRFEAVRRYMCSLILLDASLARLTRWEGSFSSFIEHVQQSRHLFWIISRNNPHATYACIFFLVTVVLYCNVKMLVPQQTLSGFSLYWVRPQQISVPLCFLGW